MDLGLKEAAVCISGGTKGMGRAAAVEFARAGARIVVTSRSQADIDKTVKLLMQEGASDAFGVLCSLPNLDQIEELFKAIDSRWGELNTLINMAGASDSQHFGADFALMTEENWEYFFQMGIMSVVRCTRLALPLMRKAGWGRVVNISSIAARNGSTAECGYMTMKAALNALSKNMALGLAKENIIVNSISPGLVITDAIEKMMIATGAPEKGYDPKDLASVNRWFTEILGGRRMAGIVGRIGVPEEIAPWITLLGSKVNTYLVGADIAIDGGTDYSPG